MPSRTINRSSEKGISLLVFAVILLVGSTYLLTASLNSNNNRYDRYEITYDYLKEAKKALIGFAVFHPDNPGMLPFPDRNGDGDYDGNSDCTTGTVTNSLLLGRLPWRGQDNPCVTPQTGLNVQSLDYSGQEIWYAVSKNLVYESPDYPFVSPAILNRNTDWITVRDQNGNVLSDRVAFVVFSPGIALTGQDRTAAAPAASNYLDSVTIGGTPYNNADTDQDFIFYPESDFTADTTDNFNDKLIYVTIDEFMDEIEERAMNELTTALTNYHSTHGAFPWLSPYADPKVKLTSLSGEADAGGSSTLLVDTTKNFIELGIDSGDIVYNITDQSIGEVSATPTITSQLPITSLSMGVDNDFDADDQYVVIQSGLQSDLNNGSATAGSSGNTLENTFRDFDELTLRLGDVVENGANRAMITRIDNDEIEVDNITGGFNSGDTYSIKTNFGIATAGSSSTQLVDSEKDFVNMGVIVGDLIWNMTDNSVARITNVTTTTLTIDRLYHGEDNEFDSSLVIPAPDEYMIPRFNKVDNTRLGHLAFHDVGELFPTQLDLTWTISNAAVADINFDNTTFAGVNATYESSVENYLEQYAEAGGTESFNNDNSFCFWSVPEIVDCYAWLDEYLSVEGDLTSGSNTTVITDSNASFTNEGVKRGDIAINYDDESTFVTGTATAGTSGTTLIDSGANFSGLSAYQYVIQNDDQPGRVQGIVSNIVNSTTLEIQNYDGQGSTDINFSSGDDYTILQPETFMVSSVNSATQLDTEPLISAANADFDNGEQYRILVAASSFSASPNSLTVCVSGATCTINDTDGDFINKGIEVGDVMEVSTLSITGFFPFSIDTQTGQGVITSVSATQLQATLYGGFSVVGLPILSTYIAYYDYVDFRRIEWHARFRGELQTTTVNQERRRDVCLNYNANCSSPNASTFSQENGGQPMITARDYQQDETTEVGRAEFSPTASSSGSILVSNIDYYLNVQTGDLPEWFIRNKWHQYFYIAYSSGGDIPGSAGVCTAGVDCLTLNIDIPNDATNAVIAQNNIRALIIYSDEELASQDRTIGLITAYLEGDPAVNANANNDEDVNDIFDKTTHINNAEVLATDYNDRIRAAVSCADGSGNLCWQ